MDLPERHGCTEADPADLAAVEAMPENYGAAEREAELAAMDDDQ